MTLTPAQTRIITLVAQGFSNKQIAGLVFRSVKTVEVHRQDVLKRLGAINSAHAVALALVHGIIDRSVITTANHDTT